MWELVGKCAIFSFIRIFLGMWWTKQVHVYEQYCSAASELSNDLVDDGHGMYME